MTVAVTPTLFPACVATPYRFYGAVAGPDAPFWNNLIWSYAIDNGPFTNFAAGATALYTTPSSVTNTDASGNFTINTISIKATNPVTMNFGIATFQLVQGAPFINHTDVGGRTTEDQPTPGTDPHPRERLEGPNPQSSTSGDTWLADEDSQTGIGSGGSCVELVSLVAESGIAGISTGGDCCGSTSFIDPDGGKMTPSGGGGPLINTPGGGNNGSLIQPAPMYCASNKVATGSQVWMRPYGMVQYKSGCGALITRGKPVELCQWFENVADGLSSSERILGARWSFGWQVRLIKDASGNVALYWGDRSVEAWKSPDGGSTFTLPKGSFGTLTKQGDGTFTRTTKDGTYYDFDSNGRLQKIKDRSSDGNVIYYNYNGSNQVVRITGPGLGYKPYFTYDANNRVNAMTLESSDLSKERVTYYDYDGSGRLNKVIWPENCISYYDYDANGNLSLAINPDNYRTYFTYGSQTVPRLQEINMPEQAAVYFGYDDTVPRHVATVADGPSREMNYQWAGLPELALVGSEYNYFSYDTNAKPTWVQGNDGTKTYYEWDSNGNLTAMRAPEDSLQYFTWGSLGRMTSWKNEEGRTTYWNYDANGYQTNWIDRAGATTYFEHDTYGKITSKKDRVGNVTYFTYNAQGLVTSRKDADLTVRYFDWNPGAEVELVIDELANVCYFTHDKRGRITKWKDFLGQATDYGYDNRSNLTIQVDRRGNAWYWEYDGLSRKVAARTALLNTAYFSYSRTNTLTSQVDPRGNPAYFYYTSELRLQARENALKELTYFTYTLAGQQESVKDARGNAQYWTYDTLHRQTSMKDGVGNVTYYRYDPDGDNTATTDPRGNTTYLYFDAMDRQFARRNALNEVSYFYFDAEGNQTCSEDALQRRTYFYYDSMNRRYCAEDAQRNRTYFTFEQRGPVSSQKNPRGYVSYLYYDKLERQFSTRDALNNVTYVEYDANSNRVAARDARGNTSYFNFDADNRNISATTPLNETTYLAYDAAANRSSVKDGRGNLSYFYFDALNRNFCSEDAKQARNYFTFDAVGNTNSEKDPLARVTYHYYDANNRRFATQDALAGFRYFTFDAASNNDSAKNPRGFVTYLYYDATNRMFCQRSPVDGLTYYSFDTVGNRTAVKDPVARLNYFYFDTLNRQYASEDGLQKRTYFEFDTVGNTVSIKNPRRATVSPAEVGIQYFTYDALNRRNSAKDEVAKVWYYDYDAASNLKVQTNPRAALTYWEYDALNRKQSQKDPLARSWYWTYDAVGNVNSVKDGKAQTTYYQYDTVNLLTRTDFPDTTKHYFEYDSARQRTAAADPTGTTYWLYDNLGRATFRKNPAGGSATAQNLYYEFDANSNRTGLKDQDGKLFYYDWDAADRMKEVRSSDYGGWITYYEYSAADQMVHEKHQNGTITYHAYDAAGRVSLIHHRTSAAAKIENWNFTRDEVGNPTVINVDTGALTTTNRYFNYDQANRIKKEAWRTTTPTNVYAFNYSYDEAGNRIAKQRVLPAQTALYWEYDLADQLTKQKTGSVTRVYFYFDNNGNMSYEHDNNASAGRTYYDYDNRNLLTRVDFPGATATNYYEYNALGERTRKWDSTAAGQFSTWDGIDVIVEKNNALTTVNRYVKGYTPVAGIGAHVMIDPGASGRTWFVHKNQVGTTLKVTDNTGATQNSYQDDAWGQPFLATEGATYRFRFNGKELDPDFILFNSNNRRYHYPARTYMPFRSSYAQFDPIYRLFFAGRFLVTAHREPLYFIAKSHPSRSVDTLGLVTAAECESAEESARLLTAGCPKPAVCPPTEVLCVCCDAKEEYKRAIGSATASAGLVTDEGPYQGKILICTDRLTTIGASAADTLRVVLHELVHAVDYCVNGLIGCTDIACSEVRAYSQSGMCSDPDSLWLKSVGGDPVACVEAWASASVASHPECATPHGEINGKAWVRLVWDSCAVSSANHCFTKTPKIR